MAINSGQRFEIPVAKIIPHIIVSFASILLTLYVLGQPPFASQAQDPTQEPISDLLPIIQSPEESNEIALYNQNQLLKTQFKNLTPGNPERIDLYFLGLAGDGSQEVFRREVEFVHNQFDDLYQSGSRSLLLINSKFSARQYPLFTHTSLNRSLAQLMTKMDKDQDILVLFATSHGSKTHFLTVNQDGLWLNSLGSEALKALLDQHQIKWKVIIISACYSGGFIKQLADDTTLVITAARPDRTSFGCSDEGHFTFFGKAYFEQSLARHGRFVRAFEEALPEIRKRENELEYKNSEPQISESPGIRDYLETFYSQE